MVYAAEIIVLAIIIAIAAAVTLTLTVGAIMSTRGRRNVLTMILERVFSTPEVLPVCEPVAQKIIDGEPSRRVKISKPQRILFPNIIVGDHVIVDVGVTWRSAPWLPQTGIVYYRKLQPGIINDPERGTLFGPREVLDQPPLVLHVQAAANGKYQLTEGGSHAPSAVLLLAFVLAVSDLHLEVSMAGVLSFLSEYEQSHLIKCSEVTPMIMSASNITARLNDITGLVVPAQHIVELLAAVEREIILS
jgi:hypothetical protein